MPEVSTVAKAVAIAEDSLVRAKGIRRLKSQLDTACSCTSADPVGAARDAHEAAEEFLRLIGGPAIAAAYRDVIRSVCHHQEVSSMAEIDAARDEGRRKGHNKGHAEGRKEGRVAGYDAGYSDAKAGRLKRE